MNILVACEESQEICKAFRKKGHNAFSCDLQDCSGGFPEYHIKGDCLKLIEENVKFKTQDNQEYFVEKWDMLIAHPPCSEAIWFNCYGNDRQKTRSKTFKEVAEAIAEQWG